MKIMKYVGKVPGGLMIIPMLITAIINTVAPQILQIGSATSGIFTSAGTMTIVGVILFIAGSQLKLNQIGMAIKRGGILCVAKIIIGFAASLIVFGIFGEKGALGVSAMAFVIAMSSCNPGVYMALVQQFGDNVDEAAFGLLNIVAVPALPILILNISSGGGFDWLSIVAVLAPFIIGMILGNLDAAIAKLMAPGTPICLVFLGFCFGSNINLVNAVKAGPSGLLIAVIFLVINVPLFFATDKFIIRRPGYAGVAFCSIAGISAAVPGIIAEIMPQFAPYAQTATAQMALGCVLTSFSAPFITKWVVSKFGSGKVSDTEVSQAPAT
ncbi:MAG: 2-keto-3-deoxygluconate permease [Actinomycetes bacterium]|jgi:2-keto-3-deoxygluconate permease|nr:2-keto-3-deoxygluconate permease [Actinomycetes bacterium]